MNIGLSSACFYPNVLTENSIKLINDIGFRSGEIFLNSTSEYEDEFIYKLNEEKLKHDFNIESIHCFSPTFEPYLFETYKRRRQDMFKYFKKVCRAARILGAKYYTFHGMRKFDFASIDKKFILDMTPSQIFVNEGPNSFELYKLLSKTEPKMKSLDEVRSTIIDQLTRKKMEKMLEDYNQEIFKSIGIINLGNV